MERALIKQGGGGYTIYLPKNWVDRKGLKEKDPINIIESEGALIIQTHAKTKKTAVLEWDKDNKKMFGVLTFLYRRGFDEITINNIDHKTINILQKFVKDSLQGFEITHKDKTGCFIESISEPVDQKYDTLTRRIFLIIKEMIVLISDSAKNNKWNPEEVEEMRRQVDRFSLFCRRMIVKEKYEHNPILGWDLLDFFTLTAHTIDYLNNYASKNKVKLSSQGISLLNDSLEQYDILYNSYYNKDINTLYKIYRYRESHLFGSCISYLEKAKGKEAVIASYIRELSRSMLIGSSPILSELLEEANEKKEVTKAQS